MSRKFKEKDKLIRFLKDFFLWRDLEGDKEFDICLKVVVVELVEIEFGYGGGFDFVLRIL